MPLTLTVADNQDGTGAVATISGGDLGETYTVYTQAMRVTAGTATTFTSSGTRSGNGTVSLTLDPGSYWCYASGEVSGTVAVSGMVYTPVSDNAKSVHERCMDAIEARIQALTMADSINDRIYKRLLPTETVVQAPCIFLTLEGEQEQDGEPQLNARDTVILPVRVQIADRNHQDYDSPRGKYLRWREQLLRALRSQRLNVAECINCVVLNHDLIVDPKLPQYQWFVSGFTLGCVVRQSRGLS